MSDKKKILICCDYFPTEENGSITAITEVLKSDYDVTLLAHQHKKPTLRNLRELLKNNEYSVIYINSYTLSRLTIYTLYLSMLRRLHKGRIILAPRDDLNASIHSIQTLKKTIFTFFFKHIFNVKNIEWHVTSLEEKQAIKRMLGDHIRVIMLPVRDAQSLANNYQLFFGAKDMHEKQIKSHERTLYETIGD